MSMDSTSISKISIPTILSKLAPQFEPLLDAGHIPDFIVRYAVRKLLEERLGEVEYGNVDVNQRNAMIHTEKLRNSPIAEHTDKANEQHYEVSTDFMRLCLGKRMKYSCCLFPQGKETLDQAESIMLESYCEKALIEDRMEILDLGCGWGSLCLYLCEKYPNAKITALSNSNTQREYIETIARENNYTNLKVITADIKEFDFGDSVIFDRILSVEMFEHMKNYELLLNKISKWLKPKGFLFIHIFCHVNKTYDFTEDDGWLSKYFFTGGTMPSSSLLLYFQQNLQIKNHWLINGTHYSKTSEHWLKLLDKNKKTALICLEETYGKGNSITWFNRWRTFFIAVSEMFKYNDGNEWCVANYLFEKM